MPPTSYTGAPDQYPGAPNQYPGAPDQYFSPANQHGRTANEYLDTADGHQHTRCNRDFDNPTHGNRYASHTDSNFRRRDRNIDVAA